MSDSTGKGHQVPNSTSLSIRLATEYNEPIVPGTTEIVPSTKELTETTTAPGGLVQHTMASQKQSVCGSLSSPAVSGDVPRPLYRIHVLTEFFLNSVSISMYAAHSHSRTRSYADYMP